MYFSQNLLSGNRKYLFALLLLSFVIIISVAFSIEESDDFNSARREVLLRRIGHELLLQSGDSLSRVLPIKKITENEYQIRFENEFTFQTDSLVNTTQRLLSKDPFASDYVVNMLNCSNLSVVFGFAISKKKKNEIIACIGRRQPIACYMINIKFKPDGIISARNSCFFGGLFFLAFFGLIFYKLVKPKKNLSKVENNEKFTFGSVLFDTQKKQLLINKTIIDLTATETRLLQIFALSPNQIIERSRLQKEIWEDDGVIVGRSLDMFISKLRKKLELEPNINIVVIRSKGYKLEILS